MTVSQENGLSRLDKAVDSFLGLIGGVLRNVPGVREFADMEESAMIIVDDSRGGGPAQLKEEPKTGRSSH